MVGGDGAAVGKWDVFWIKRSTQTMPATITNIHKCYIHVLAASVLPSTLAHPYQPPRQ